MTNLNLSGQENRFNGIKPKLTEFNNLLDSRKVVWDKLPPEAKKKWVENEDDPIMYAAYKEYLRLKEFFGGDM